MANAATEVFRAHVPDVGLTLKVRANIEHKQSEYEKRIKEDNPTSNCCVPYKANVDWKCAFNEGGASLETVAANDEKQAKPVFFETKYFFRGDFDPPKPIKSVSINHRLASVEDSFNYDEGVLVGTLDFVNEPGRFRLELKVVFEDGTKRTIWFEFFVVSVKMNIRRDYDVILKTIEAARPRLAQSFLGKSFWGAALGEGNNNDDKTWYQILSDIFEYYVQACKRIVNNPHQRYVRVGEYRHADRIKRWSPTLVNRFNRLGEDQRAAALFRTERVEGATDTPENRFVLYTLKELAGRLGRFAAAQDKNDLVSKEWIKGVHEMSADLLKLSHHPFFTAVGRFEGFRQQSLVMQKQAGYAQIFTVWLKLKRTLEPGGDDVDVSYRPISMLYEFWCFLEMRRLLAAHFGEPVKDEVKTSTEDELLETPELTDGTQIDENKLSKLNVEYKAKDGVTCVLAYQKTYNVQAIDGVGEQAFSSLNPQRPDIVLTLKSSEGEYSYLFDAKYRIWSLGDADGTTRDAIDAMYRYRDAILYRMQKAGVKREIIGAFVLYPGRPAPHLYEKYRKTIEQEGVGAIPLLPNFDAELKDNITKIVTRHAPAERLKTATSVRGTSVVVGEAFGEGDVLEVPVGVPDWDMKVRADRLEIPLGQLKGRDPRLIKYVRFLAPNKPKLMAKVEFHSRPTVSGAGDVVYDVMTTLPQL